MRLSGGSLWNKNGNDIYYSLGNVGIGTDDTKGYELAVAGKTISEKIKVALIESWPDYVFWEGYRLKSLEDLEEFIIINKHLLILL